MAISDRLETCREVLAGSPFRDPEPPWLQTRPRLANDLLSLTTTALGHLERNPQALTRWLGERDSDYVGLAELTSLHPWTAYDERGRIPPAPRYASGIPGRKWTQIRLFLDSVQPGALTTTDWCSGKGYLARILATETGSTVHCIERQLSLCDRGAAESTTLPLHFECADVIDASPPLAPRLYALHSCGALHDRAIQRAMERGSGVRELAIAPCCYHLRPGESQLRPLSQSGPKQTLPLELARLACAETVTAPRRQAAQRQRILAWRLAFDAWRRSMGEAPELRHVPSLPPHVSAGGYRGWCEFATAHLHSGSRTHPAPSALQAHWLALGRRQARRVRRLDLARTGLRRLLELRVVLDRALALAEQGWNVGVGRFCAPTTSPRNVLIRAVRTDGQPHNQRSRGPHISSSSNG